MRLGGVIALLQTEELKVQKLIARHKCSSETYCTSQVHLANTEAVLKGLAELTLSTA